jgi:hypothetical protein
VGSNLSIYRLKKPYIELYQSFFVAIVAAAIYVGYAYWQPVYTYGQTDPRMDAHKYAAMYDYFLGSTPVYQISFPFNTRILVPWLAAQLPFEKIDSFLIINGVFVVLTVLLLTALWLRLGIKWQFIGAALFWILLHWKGLLRMYLPDPLTADVMGYFLMSIWLYCLSFGPNFGSPKPLDYNKFDAYKGSLVLLIAVLGVLQKESFLAVILVSIFIANQKQNRFFVALCFVISVILYLTISYLYPSYPTNWRNNPLVTIARMARHYITQPNLLPTILTSWLLAFGTFWLSLIGSKTNSSTTNHSHIAHHTSSIQLLAILWLLLSILGGGDTARIAYNGLPFVMTYFLLKLNKKPVWVAYFIVLTALPLMRLPSLEPDLGLYPKQSYDWCVECWAMDDAWPYWLYAAVVSAVYYYFCSRRLGLESDKISTRR